MTPEERLTKLEEAMLVNASLMNRIELNMDRLERKAEEHEDGIAELRQSQSNLNSAMNALFEHMDRFIRGMEGNGYKQ